MSLAETNLEQILKTLSPELNHGEYIFYSTNDPSQFDQKDIIGLFNEKEGVTVIISRELADRKKIPYKFIASWITLNVHSSLDAVGLTAAFSTALAKVNISANVIAGYYHDHIFVAKEDADRAMNALMKLTRSYRTDRLLLEELNSSDNEFLLELVNTSEWIRFIGDRNMRTMEDANLYIQKIIDNPKACYWVVRLHGQQSPMGIITFIKRDYLDHYDIGFAFLSKYTGKGYAYEATIAILKDVVKSPTHTHILATTVKGNVSSIKLLEKLGLRFDREITREGDLLAVYSVAVDKLFLK